MFWFIRADDAHLKAQCVQCVEPVTVQFFVFLLCFESHSVFVVCLEIYSWQISRQSEMGWAFENPRIKILTLDDVSVMASPPLPVCFQLLWQRCVQTMSPDPIPPECYMWGMDACQRPNLSPCQQRVRWLCWLFILWSILHSPHPWFHYQL